MLLYRLVNFLHDSTEVGDHLQRTSSHSNQKLGTGTYFALCEQDALAFASSQHGHVYTHLVECSLKGACATDFVDLRNNLQAISGTGPITERYPSHCQQWDKAGVIWTSGRWDELVLYEFSKLKPKIVRADELERFREQVALQAFWLWKERGEPFQDDWRDWFDARTRLAEKSSRKPTTMRRAV